MTEKIQCRRENETLVRNDSPSDIFLNVVKKLKIDL